MAIELMSLLLFTILTATVSLMFKEGTFKTIIESLWVAMVLFIAVKMLFFHQGNI